MNLVLSFSESAYTTHYRRLLIPLKFAYFGHNEYRHPVHGTIHINSLGGYKHIAKSGKVSHGSSHKTLMRDILNN